MKVLQIGRYPPPYGGVTIHIQRLAEYCLANDIECEVLDLYHRTQSNDVLPAYVKSVNGSGPRRYWDTLRLLRSQHADIAHLHVSALGRSVWGLPLLLSLIHSRRRVITLHHGNFAESYCGRSGIEKAIVCGILDAMDAVIFPTDELQRKVVTVLGQHIHRSEVAPTFISFNELESSQSFGPFDDFAGSLSTDHSARPPILLISGFGLPYYGFDLFVEALDRLAAEGKRAAVVLSFYGQGDRSYMENVVAAFTRLAPVLVVHNLIAEDFHYLLRGCDIYVRPNTVDSCGVTVYEALAFGTSCIASDVCTRPPGTILHKNQDAESLTTQLRNELARLSNNRSKRPSVPKMHGGEQKLLALYKDLLR